MKAGVRGAGQGVVEVRYDNLHTTIDFLKAKAALRSLAREIHAGDGP